MLSGLISRCRTSRIGLRWLSNFVWARYYIEIVRDALLQGGGWPAIWKCCRSPASGRLFFGLGWRRMRRMQLEV